MNQHDPIDKHELGAHALRSSFLDALTDGLTGMVGSVFGAPIDRDGVTVIPVARARWGMGGGFAPKHPLDRGPGGEPSFGGGGGTIVKPVGFIELRQGQARFRAIPDRVSTAWAIVWVLLSGLSAYRMLGGHVGRRTREGTRFTMRRRRRLFGRMLRK
jgi:uncharacterized spore protein YtfJ